MLELKAQDKKFNGFTEIDKFALIPKKKWDDFELGENTLVLNGSRHKVRVYEVPCTCIGQRHTHRILDLRSVWNKMDLRDHERIEVDKQ